MKPAALFLVLSMFWLAACGTSSPDPHIVLSDCRLSPGESQTVNLVGSFPSGTEIQWSVDVGQISPMGSNAPAAQYTAPAAIEAAGTANIMARILSNGSETTSFLVCFLIPASDPTAPSLIPAALSGGTSASPLPAPTHASIPSAFTNSKNTELHAGPDAKYGVVGIYPRGIIAELQARTENAEWVYVRMPDEKEGWLYVGWLDIPAWVIIKDLPVPPGVVPGRPTPTLKPKQPPAATDTAAPPPEAPTEAPTAIPITRSPSPH